MDRIVEWTRCGMGWDVRMGAKLADERGTGNDDN